MGLRMKSFRFTVHHRVLLADTITPVGVYLKVRDIFPQSVLLEGADYHGGQNAYSFICLQPIAHFHVNDGHIRVTLPGSEEQTLDAGNSHRVADELFRFLNAFAPFNTDSEIPVNGLFGYTAWEGVRHFEDIRLKAPVVEEEKIPEIRYDFYRFIIAINHYKDILHLIENLPEGEFSEIDRIESLLYNRSFVSYPFRVLSDETSNLSDAGFMELVEKGRKHCHLGDVFQVVFSRQFSQAYRGDDFNVYRALRSINPSPYLFYFDYGSYRLFGSSPEAQLQIIQGRAIIHPIAGTFKRTGNDQYDKEMAERLMLEEKENAEHVMLVDLARNDLGRSCSDISVEVFREIQYYSHVIHMVSRVSGKLPEGYNPVQVFAGSFPAGTLSGAPKYRAMELIDNYENKSRGFYGGAIGNIGLKGELNHAIMIRTFLSKNNRLFYQAGAGIVARSKKENELQEVNQKLMALKSAIRMAEKI